MREHGGSWGLTRGHHSKKLKFKGEKKNPLKKDEDLDQFFVKRYVI